MPHSEMKTVVLSALQAEQQQCVTLIERARRYPHIKHDLTHALTIAVDTYRALRSGALDWRAALVKYSEVSEITTATDTAFWLDYFAQDRSRVMADFEARLERLTRRGLAAADSDGVYSLTSAGRAVLDSGELSRLD